MNNNRRQRIIASLCLIGMLLNNAMVFAVAQQSTAPVQGPITYAELGDKLISSYGIVGENQELLTPEQEEERKKKEQEFNFDIPQPTDQQKRQTVWGILTRNDRRNPSQAKVDAYE